MPGKYLGETVEEVTLAADDRVAVALDGITEDLKNIRLSNLQSALNIPSVEGLQQGISGLRTGGQLAVNGNNISVDITAGTGFVVDNYTDVDNPTVNSVSWNNVNAVIPNIATEITTFIFIDNTGTPFLTNSIPTQQEYRENIFLGTATHTGATVDSVVQRPRVFNQSLYSFMDLIAATNATTIVQSGMIPTGVVAAQSVDITAGELFSLGANWHVDRDDPNNITVGAQSPMSFGVVDRNGNIIQPFGSTAFDPSVFDDNGVITAVGGNNAVIHRIYRGTGSYVIQLGQREYGNLLNAEQSLATDRGLFVIEENLEKFTAIAGYIIAAGNATDFGDITDAVIIPRERRNS